VVQVFQGKVKPAFRAGGQTVFDLDDPGSGPAAEFRNQIDLRPGAVR
jgi:hypothetical protein